MDEEITWEDDENHATLFLRSVFVLFSGLILLRTSYYISVDMPLFYILGLSVVLPVGIIWLFFGQGLRSVEWLNDQKYNAWNYGINFQDWKTHLRWAAFLLALIILSALVRHLLMPASTNISWNPGLISTIIFAACAVWLIFGYLWFGCAQGFGAIAATIIVAAYIGAAVYPLYQAISYQVIAAVIFALAGSGICWKTRSIAPILYAAIVGAPLLITLFSFV